MDVGLERVGHRLRDTLVATDRGQGHGFDLVLRREPLLNEVPHEQRGIVGRRGVLRIGVDTPERSSPRTTPKLRRRP